MRTNLTTQIMRLRKRRAQLREILALESEIDGMELRLLGHTSSDIRAILEAVCLYTGISVSAVMSPLRPAHVSAARHATWYLIKKVLVPRPRQELIARIFHRGHSAISHGVRSAEHLRDTNHKFRAMLEQIEAKCKQNEN